MASLSDADRAAIERRIGSVPDGDVEALEVRLERLGSPCAVALEVLMIRLAERGESVGKLRIDGDVTFETGDTDLEALNRRVAKVAAECGREVGLNAAALELVDSALSAAGVSRFTPYTVDHDRPGG